MVSARFSVVNLSTYSAYMPLVVIFYFHSHFFTFYFYLFKLFIYGGISAFYPQHPRIIYTVFLSAFYHSEDPHFTRGPSVTQFPVHRCGETERPVHPMCGL